jgi:acyl-CoA reductase-like NAD-dependent aldehyde dehydrogenase
MAEAPAPAVAAPNLFQTVNPATGEKGPAYQGRTVDEALSIAADVHRAQIAWRRTGFKERAPLMKNAAEVIRDNSMRYAKLMTDEMGKPIADSLAELDKCASCCEYFAEMSDKILKPVNQNVRSDPRLPFGGVKNSGYGREVSEFGIREFCNIKTVLIEEL